MIVNKEISNALHFAIDAHGDQKRTNGQQYVHHVIRVAERVSALLNYDALSNEVVVANNRYTETVVAALLHDVVEDTFVKISQIREKFGDRVANTVLSLTTANLSEEEIIQKANGWNYWTRVIKLADIFDNLTEARDCWDTQRLIKYAKKKRQLILISFNASDVGYDETLKLCDKIIGIA